VRAEDLDDVLLRAATPSKGELFSVLGRTRRRWRPQPGPQSLAFVSKADIVGYGGAAGGGKTDLLLGAMLRRHRRGIIFRREGTQLSAVIDRMAEILGGRGGFNAAERVWRLEEGRQLEFGSVPTLGDEAKHQGRPHDFIGFDEAASFLESQVRFLLGWLRTTARGQRCRAILAFNPPTTAEGRWVVPFFGPWLDPAHPNPAAPGELRWFATVDGEELEVGREPFVHAGETIRPMSRTFIASRVQDNPFLVNTGYISTLQALPEPLRSQMLMGDFSAGMEDDPWQVIPTRWIEEACARWAPRAARGPMDSMGVDVARGGRDQTVIARRHGAWFDELVALPGAETPDGAATGSLVLSYRRDLSPVHIDVVGWGASPYDFLVGNRIQAVAVNGAEKCVARAADDTVGFANRRAEMWWRMREALDPLNPDPVALPPDAALKADLAAPRWKLGISGVLVESKDEMRKRLGRSPDRGDAACMALMATVKAMQSRHARNRPAGYVA
jgi:hypothetical protein